MTDGLRVFQKPVGQCAFPMIDMGYNTEIPNVLHKSCKDIVPEGF
jgi:hypothetical protein